MMHSKQASGRAGMYLNTKASILFRQSGLARSCKRKGFGLRVLKMDPATDQSVSRSAHSSLPSSETEAQESPLDPTSPI
jgi:hypothetical protein